MSCVCVFVFSKGQKMSKSKGNVVDPGLFIDQYGADVFRMYLMFMGPYDLGGDWSDKGIVGVDRFVQRVYALFTKYENQLRNHSINHTFDFQSLADSDKELYSKVNFSLKKYYAEIENFRFNTGLAVLMELLNEVTKNIEKCSNDIVSYTLERFTYMLAPLAPHLSEECWSVLGMTDSIFNTPKRFDVDEKSLVVDEVTIVVQVNGKIRAKLILPANSDEEVVKETAWADNNVKTHTFDKTVVKEIYIKNKIYNIVVK